MAALANRVQNALDEGRILILGAQILLGFEYRAFFEPRYDELPAWAHAAKLLALALLVVTFALVVLPTPFHQLVEEGCDTLRLHRLATRALAAALLPLAVALGLDLASAAPAVDGIGAAAGVSLGAGGTVLALALWYALPAARRRRYVQEDAVPETPLAEKIKHVLTETRMVLPGAQALLGFQLAVTMMEAFARLPRGAQQLHLADTALTALAVVLLLTPAAFHRLAEDGEETARFHRLASRFVLAALAPLGVALSGDLGIIGYRVTGELAPAVGLAAGAAALFLAAWLVLPLAARVAGRHAGHAGRAPAGARA
ncbi:DUF6328 family protein [Anaeromyxobacter diazotrophicus]|uniref:Uncharacterized protein n=1 Tax=Anaeromyxobacter diazotrophicus TaxID=2590199 RepID=A0A7I9VH62_9BACT|nr:DUF6328 family protein [Anaeromyxobacter diazotrophicus]GEJ55731.1 hypothetical protein AMYX_04720 [Anaeromyxobacter diazotrophicus]